MWFCASVMKIAERNGKRGTDSLWEEQFVLIEADGEEVAHKEAETLASRREAPYKNDKGELISWQFVKVERVYTISEEKLRSGVEVFSRFLRHSEAKSLMTRFEEDEH
jgi:hypothetical protein